MTALLLRAFTRTLPLAIFLFSGSFAQAKKVKGEAKLTAYYIAEIVVNDPEGERVKGTYIDIQGEKHTYSIAKKYEGKAVMEGTVATVDKKGKRKYFTRIGHRKWQELPVKVMGWGNRENPLVAWKHVAADQSIHPYGSRVFIPAAKGFKTPDGQVLDGYFWVADTGGRIKGNLRFDVFVGAAPVYWKMIESSAASNLDVEVEHFPVLSPELHPKTIAGTKNILRKLGYSFDEKVDESGSDSSFENALRCFQKKFRDIPDPEFGFFKGAVTQWYLAQSALEL